MQLLIDAIFFWFNMLINAIVLKYVHFVTLIFTSTVFLYVYVHDSIIDPKFTSYFHTCNRVVVSYVHNKFTNLIFCFALPSCTFLQHVPNSSLSVLFNCSMICDTFTLTGFDFAQIVEQLQSGTRPWCSNGGC